jgi:hypothetical protein
MPTGPFIDLTSPLVTLGGECFDVAFQGSQHGPPDNFLYLFYISDKTKTTNLRKVSVERFGPKEWCAKDYDARMENVVLNVIRRGFDEGKVGFDLPEDPHYFKKLPLSESDFEQQPQVGDQEIRQFIIHTAFWLSYRYGSRYPVQFDSPMNVDYLGVTAEDIRRNVWLLEEDGLLAKSKISGIGLPTATLVKMYEAKQSTVLGNERVFPKGTQYEAFKEIKNILRSATKEIFIVDNYVDDTVLDILAALPVQPSLKLLTSNVPKDFSVAVKKFSSQYRRPVEVRLHQREIHDRALVIDDMYFYALGASIKDAGSQLFFINRVEDPTNISRLRTELRNIWALAKPL